MINPDHLAMLAASGIPEVFAALRGYETVENSTCLRSLHLANAAQSLVPGLMFPLLHADGSTAGWQYRPDNPRLREGKPAKYEMPVGQSNVVDVPPGVGGWLSDPAVDLWITEGTKKADCGAARGLCPPTQQAGELWPRTADDRAGRLARRRASSRYRRPAPAGHIDVDDRADICRVAVLFGGGLGTVATRVVVRQ